MAASTEWTVPSVTLPAVLLANSGACVTGAARLGHIERAVEKHRRRVASRCTVLRIALVLEPRDALTPESSQNPFRRMHVR